jgi:type IV secretion system protein VirB11
MREKEALESLIKHMLTPVQEILDHPEMTDFHINGVGEKKTFIDIGRGMEQITLPYTFRDLEDLAVAAAAYTHQDITATNPLVGTRLPGNHRVTIAMPSATMDGTIVFSIRKPKAVTGTPDDLERTGVFDNTKRAGSTDDGVRREMEKLYKEGRFRLLIEAAIGAGMNVVFSGSVGTGKTHNMRFFTDAIPKTSRIVTVEDTHELVNMPHPNIVHLFYSKGGQSAANIKAEDLVEAGMRLGMNWIINQELRDEAAYSYLYVLESGHSGMTSVHAGSAQQTRDRIRGLVKKHPRGMHMADADIMASLYRSIDVIAYCVRDGDNRRYIKEVLYDPELKDRYSSAPTVFHEREAA